MATRKLLVLAPAILAALSSSAARGADAGKDPVQTPPLKQEIAGLEVAPASLGTGVSSMGIGATLRLGRHRWPSFYWTPVQGGLFLGGPGFKETVLVKIQTEVGLVRRCDLGTIEAGLGLGPGMLSMEDHSFFCNDGACGVGGMGIMFSPVVRFLFRERATHTVATFIRAELPVGTTHGETTIYLRGFGMAVLFGLDFAVGWG